MKWIFALFLLLVSCRNNTTKCSVELSDAKEVKTAVVEPAPMSNNGWLAEYSIHGFKTECMEFNDQAKISDFLGNLSSLFQSSHLMEADSIVHYIGSFPHGWKYYRTYKVGEDGKTAEFVVISANDSTAVRLFYFDK